MFLVWSRLFPHLFPFPPKEKYSLEFVFTGKGCRSSIFYSKLPQGLKLCHNWRTNHWGYVCRVTPLRSWVTKTPLPDETEDGRDEVLARGSADLENPLKSTPSTEAENHRRGWKPRDLVKEEGRRRRSWKLHRFSPRVNRGWKPPKKQLKTAKTSSRRKEAGTFSPLQTSPSLKTLGIDRHRWKRWRSRSLWTKAEEKFWNLNDLWIYEYWKSFVICRLIIICVILCHNVEKL